MVLLVLVTRFPPKIPKKKYNLQVSSISSSAHIYTYIPVHIYLSITYSTYIHTTLRCESIA